MIKIIVAYDKNRGIGLSNDLPWNIPGELKWVFETTTKVSSPEKRNALLMGKNTWESIPEARRPLKGRLNIIVSKSLTGTNDANTMFFKDLDEAITFAKSSPEIEDCFVFGGAQIYKQCLDKGYVEKILATEIEKAFEVDTYFPEIPPSFSVETKAKQEVGDFQFTRATYKLG